MLTRRLRPSESRVGDTPRIAPEIWDATRYSADREGDNGFYILIGPIIVDWNQIHHSGTGRIARMRMQTMSLHEFVDSIVEVSFGDLFRGSRCSGLFFLKLKDIARIIIHSGWPRVIRRSKSVVCTNMKNYCQSILESEIMTADGRRRNRQKMERILRFLIRNTAGQVSDTKILDDTTFEENGVKGSHQCTSTPFGITRDTWMMHTSWRTLRPGPRS